MLMGLTVPLPGWRGWGGGRGDGPPHRSHRAPSFLSQCGQTERAQRCWEAGPYHTLSSSLGVPTGRGAVLGPETLPAQDSCPPEPGSLRVGSPPSPPQEARKPEPLTQPSGTRVGLWLGGGQLPSGVCGEDTSAWDGASSGHGEPSQGFQNWAEAVSPASQQLGNIAISV